MQVAASRENGGVVEFGCQESRGEGTDVAYRLSCRFVVAGIGVCSTTPTLALQLLLVCQDRHHRRFGRCSQRNQLASVIRDSSEH